MAMKFANAPAIAACDAIVDLIDVGTPASTLVIYSGAQPANPGVAIGAQVPLVTFALPDPAFGNAAAVSGGAAASMNAVTSVAAAATGTAAFFRIFDGNGAAIMDGVVSDTSGSGDVKLSSTSIVSGVDISVVSLTFTQPKGW